MNTSPFDRITRGMATGTSRRGLLKAFAAGVAGLAVTAIRPRATEAGVVIAPTGPALPGQPCTNISLTAAQYTALNQCCTAVAGAPGTAAWGSCIALGECNQGICAGTCANTGGSGCLGNPNCFCAATPGRPGGFCTRDFTCCAFPGCGTGNTCASGQICVGGNCGGRCIPLTDACQPGQTGFLPSPADFVRHAFSNGKTNSGRSIGPPTTPFGQPTQPHH